MANQFNEIKVSQKFEQISLPRQTILRKIKKIYEHVVKKKFIKLWKNENIVYYVMMRALMKHTLFKCYFLFKAFKKILHSRKTF